MSWASRCRIARGSTPGTPQRGYRGARPPLEGGASTTRRRDGQVNAVQQPGDRGQPTARGPGRRSPTAHPGWRRSPGGLVTAIEPVMRANDGAWIGWPGGTDPRTCEPFEDDGMQLVPMTMSAGRHRGLTTRASPTPPSGRSTTTWSPSRSSTASGGTPTSRSTTASPRRPPRPAAEGATVWVHDYQLQLVPRMLRELRPDLRIGFFLHIPFPPTELFQQLPWRRQLLEGLLGADLVGFQRRGAAENFVRLVRQRVGHKTHRDLRLPARRPHRAGRGVPDLDRRRRLRGAGPLGAGRRSAPPRSARRSATRARSSSASTGSTTPRASTPGSGRSAS